MTELTIELNGQQAAIPAGYTVRDLVSDHTGKQIGEDGRALDGTRLGVAVAVNGEVVPRSGWAGRALAAASRIDLVTAAQGG